MKKERIITFKIDSREIDKLDQLARQTDRNRARLSEP